MRIIIRKDDQVDKCYVQLRDIKFLSTKYKSIALKNLYLKYLDLGTKDEDFIKMTEPRLIEIFTKANTIVDLDDYVNLDPLVLARTIYASSFSLSTDKLRRENEHRNQDIADIYHFLTGDLTYPIPIMYDNKYLIENEDKSITLGSTIIPDYYIINGINKDNSELISYLEDNLEDIITNNYPDEEVNYKVQKLNDNILVIFNHQKKKKHILKKIFKKKEN